MGEIVLHMDIHFEGKPLVRWNGGTNGPVVAVRDNDNYGGFTIYTDIYGVNLWAESMVEFVIEEGDVEQVTKLRNALNDHLIKANAILAGTP